MFLLLVIVHELGHFIAAKAMGVRVNEFAVGFGPKLFSFQKGETKYSFNLIPLGGFCAMEGEDEKSTDERAFCSKPAYKRFIIVVAGAVFNLILGLILVAVSLAPGKLFSTTTIARFEENSISSSAGMLKVNDKIVEIDGRKIYTLFDLSYAFTGISDGKVDIDVIREGEKVHLKDVTFGTEEVDGVDYLLVDFRVYGEEKTFGNYISQTFKTAFSYVRVVWFSLIDLISGKFGLNAVSSPVGVTAAVGTAAKQNIANIWPIMALITINLGVFNLLPVPALDGGRLLFILIEMIFRKPVPQKFESLVHGIGFGILILFMILITFKDIWKLIAG